LAIRKVAGVDDGFHLPTSAETIRRRPVRRLVEPWLERRHTYARYAAFLQRLTAFGAVVAPLRELWEDRSQDRLRFGVRHDVDLRLDAALQLGRIEREHGVRTTYYVLHSAPYYSDPELIPRLRELQALGHEVGLHYDLVTLQVVEGGDPRAYLRAELERLRGAGIDVVGVAAHGAYWAHRLGYKNDYFFRELSTPQEGFPHVDEVDGTPLAKGTLAEFGLAYDAAQLEPTHYWSDSRVDAAGRRWHPDRLDVAALRSGDLAIALVHPDHWDATLAAKLTRTVRRLAGSSLRARR
jgi:hypothetical protein